MGFRWFLEAIYDISRRFSADFGGVTDLFSEVSKVIMCIIGGPRRCQGILGAVSESFKGFSAE